MLNCDFNKVAYLQEHTHAKVWFHSLLFHKLHFGMGISCKFAAYFHILGLSNTFRKKNYFHYSDACKAGKCKSYGKFSDRLLSNSLKSVIIQHRSSNTALILRSRNLAVCKITLLYHGKKNRYLIKSGTS